MVSVNLNTLNWKHLFWMLDICVFLFVIPFLSLHLLKLQIDIYYLIFFLGTAGFMILYVRRSSLEFRPALLSGWALGAILAVSVGLGFYSISLSGSAGQPGFFSGWPAALIFWRGILYGFAISIMVSVLPFVVTWRSLAGPRPGGLRRIFVTFLAVIFVALASFSQVLGSVDPQSKSLKKLLISNVVGSLPTLVSGNPLAAPVAGALIQLSNMSTQENGGFFSQSNKDDQGDRKSDDGGSN